MFQQVPPQPLTSFTVLKIDVERCHKILIVESKLQTTGI